MPSKGNSTPAEIVIFVPLLEVGLSLEVKTLMRGVFGTNNAFQLGVKLPFK